MVKRSHKYEGLLWRKTLKVIKACLYKNTLFDWQPVQLDECRSDMFEFASA